jgi:hypothetical protein
MKDLEKRRAEAIKAYQDSQAQARERAERERQRRDKWDETSKLVVAGVKRASDNFAREGSAFVFVHSPYARASNPADLMTHFDIQHDLSGPRLGHLEFILSADGRVSIKTSHHCSPNVPEAVDVDEITASLAEEIASEVLIEVLNYESGLV